MKSNAINTFKIGFALLIIVFFGTSCRKNPFKADVSDIQPDIEIIRFEQVLFSADPATIETSIPLWKKEYGVFFDHFCTITNLGNSNDPAFPDRLKMFVTDYYNYRVYSRTMEVFPDLDKLNKDIRNAFRHYLYYFPARPVPKVYTYVSGLNQSAITDDTLLAIGLDKYLGRNDPLYRDAGFYNYLVVNMYPEKIVSDCMRYWAETEFTFNDSVGNLIAHMIYQGRLLYFTSAMLPDQADSVNWGFSNNDLEYMKTAEKSMWAYLIEHKLLFNTDKFTVDKFVLDGPFTKDFGRGSPSRASVWIGYRIVESYMHRNKGLTIRDLMNETNYAKILNNSGYNP